MRMERFLNFDVFLSDEAMPHGVEHLRECHGHLGPRLRPQSCETDLVGTGAN